MFTVITAFFDLARREPNIKRKDLSFYLNHGKSLFDLPLNIVIYCDPEVKDKISEFKRPEGTKTKIIPMKLEEVEFYSDLELIKKSRATGGLINSNPNKDTPLFTLVQWTKFEFLKKSVKEITWPERNIAWIDFGLSYIAKDLGRLVELIPTEKMKLLCLRPTYIQEIGNLEFFRYINGRTGGGVLCLPLDKAEFYYILFKEAKNMFLGKGLSPLEDEILTYIRVNNPKLFDLYYGDYENIVQNFNNECWSGDSIIQLAITSCIQFKDFKTISTLAKQIYKNRKNLTKTLNYATLHGVLSIYLSILTVKKSPNVSKVAQFVKSLEKMIK